MTIEQVLTWRRSLAEYNDSVELHLYANKFFITVHYLHYYHFFLKPYKNKAEMKWR